MKLVLLNHRRRVQRLDNQTRSKRQYSKGASLHNNRTLLSCIHDCISIKHDRSSNVMLSLRGAQQRELVVCPIVIEVQSLVHIDSNNRIVIVVVIFKHMKRVNEGTFGLSNEQNP